MLEEFLHVLEPLPSFRSGGKPDQVDKWKYKSGYRDGQKDLIELLGQKEVEK